MKPAATLEECHNSLHMQLPRATLWAAEASAKIRKQPVSHEALAGSNSGVVLFGNNYLKPITAYATSGEQQAKRRPLPARLAACATAGVTSIPHFSCSSFSRLASTSSTTCGDTAASLA